MGSERRSSGILATGQATQDKKVLSRIWKLVARVWVAHGKIISAFRFRFRKRSFISQLIFSISLSADRGVRPTFPCEASAGV